MKPLIGITCNYDYRELVGIASCMGVAGQDWNFLSGDYVYAVQEAGGIPVLIPQFKNFDDAKVLLDRLDGVLVSGGHDVGAENYGAFPKPYAGMVVAMRDAQDIAVTKYMTFERDKPVLGICRGIQIMNVAFGGTLYQDLEKEGGFEHHFGDKYPRNTPWHSVSFEKNSLMASIYGADKIMVNSFHHQGVKTAGKDVRITALSSDGVSEAIELQGHKFVVGVQWHPEMMFDSQEQKKLLRFFVKECAE
jgi:putative glutamine amidotransferase